MATQMVTLEYQDRVCILTLNRSQQRNSMNEQLAKDFQKAVSEVKNNPKVKVLIVTGAGRAFCAGADLKIVPKWTKKGPVSVGNELFNFYRFFLCITELQVPTIAAINGPAIGAGGCLALACDLRIAAEEAKIGFTFIKLGVNPGMGSEYFLSRLMGPARTLELLMTGDILTADEALRIGLVNKVVSSKKLMEYVREFAGKLAAMPALPIRVIKESTYTAAGSTLTEVLRKEAVYQGLCFQTKNVEEGIKAIQEKRKPRFYDES